MAHSCAPNRPFRATLPLKSGNFGRKLNPYTTIRDNSQAGNVAVLVFQPNTNRPARQLHLLPHLQIDQFYLVARTQVDHGASTVLAIGAAVVHAAAEDDNLMIRSSSPLGSFASSSSRSSPDMALSRS